MSESQVRAMTRDARGQHSATSVTVVWAEVKGPVLPAYPGQACFIPVVPAELWEVSPLPVNNVQLEC